MTKYIIYRDSMFGKKYLTNIINKRPYSSRDKDTALSCGNKELAEFVAEQAWYYSGNNWKVMEVDNVRKSV